MSETVWWPGIARDIQLTRESCAKCVRNAPSPPAAPPHPLPVLDYPFQMVLGDYFAYSGFTHLVLVDRYSGWPMVIKCKEDLSEELVCVMGCATPGVEHLFPPFKPACGDGS